MLTIQEVQALHARCYDGEPLTHKEAAAVSEWICNLEPGDLPGFVLGLYMTKYVRDGAPVYPAD